MLLIPSSAGRWIIPKGDIDDGLAPHRAAEQEAFEEGGVRGRIGDRPIGTFRTFKQQDGAVVAVEVDVFPLEVRHELEQWPEMEQRDRQWHSAEKAAGIVDEPELAAILRSFSSDGDKPPLPRQP